MRAAKPQLDLPLATLQRRPREPEPLQFWRVVVGLRRAGISVYRSGAAHKVDGRILSTREFWRFAAQIQ